MTPEELRAAVEQFEQSGGVIQQLDRSASVYTVKHKPITDPVLLSQVSESTVGVVELAKQAKRSAHTLYRAAHQLGIEFPNSREARKKRRAELAPLVRQLAPAMGQAAVGKKTRYQQNGRPTHSRRTQHRISGKEGLAMHSDSTSIQLRELDRQSLARAMEEYERGTKVVTSPIEVRTNADPYNGRRSSKELSEARNKGRIKALAANKAANLAKKKGKALLREEW